MRIACPACEAEYDVPDAAAGRKVRCARCQTVWPAVAPPPAFEYAPEPAELGAPVPPPAVPHPAEPVAPALVPTTGLAGEPPPLVAEPPLVGPRRRTRSPAESEPAEAGFAVLAAGQARARPVLWIAAWALSLAVIGAAGWAGLHYRADVIRLWPATERLYASPDPAKT